MRIMSDQYKNTSTGLESPAQGAFSVTPNDATDLTMVTRALYIGGAGDVAVTMKGGGEVTFSGLAAGQFMPVRVVRVKDTGTTASNILGLV